MKNLQKKEGGGDGDSKHFFLTWPIPYPGVNTPIFTVLFTCFTLLNIHVVPATVPHSNLFIKFMLQIMWQQI